MKLLYPGHNYLGPGNPLPNGEPVDKADEIARDHDYEYRDAKSELDVHLSDAKAIARFSANSGIAGGFDIPSNVGALGLAAKKVGEYYSGTTLYPLKFNKFVNGANTISKAITGSNLINTEEDMPKRQKLENGEGSSSDNVTSTSDGAVNPQAGSSLPGGTGADVMATIIKNPHTETIRFCFNKTFQMYTGGFQFKQVTMDAFFPTATFAGVFEANAKAFLTPLAVLDPSSNWLYMTPTEFFQLPEFAFAKQCAIKVTPLGYRLPFQTNESAAGYANSQTLVQCCYATGLNTIMNMAITNYEIDTADPTNVNTQLGTEPNYQAIMYGNSANIGAIAGVPKHFNQYTAILQNRPGGPGPLTESPPLTDHISIRNVNDCKGVPIINFTHEFKNGILNFPVNQSQRAILNGPHTTNKGRLNEGFAPALPNYYDSGPPSAGGSIYVNTLQNFVIGAGGSLTRADCYELSIEKSAYLERQIGMHQTPDYNPLVHFGTMPVPNNVALAATETFSPSVIQWEIQTMLEVEVNLNSMSAYSQMPYLKSWDPLLLGGPSETNTQAKRCLLVNNRKLDIVPSAPNIVKKINK